MCNLIWNAYVCIRHGHLKPKWPCLIIEKVTLSLMIFCFHFYSFAFQKNQRFLLCLTNGAYWPKTLRLLRFWLERLDNSHSVSFLDVSFIAYSKAFFLLYLGTFALAPHKLNKMTFKWRSMTFLTVNDTLTRAESHID